MTWPALYAQRIAALPVVSKSHLILQAACHLSTIAFKYGRSLNLYLPVDISDNVLDLLHHLHHIRTLGSNHQLLGSWSCGRNMSRRKVLVFWTRPAPRLKSLLRLEHHDLRVMRNMPENAEVPCTVILDGGPRLADHIMQIGLCDQVFVHVIDASPQVGLGADAIHVANAIHAIAPEVPVMTIGITGSARNVVPSEPGQIGRLDCIFRQQDDKLIQSAVNSKQCLSSASTPVVWVVPDEISDEHLSTICQQLAQVDRLTQHDSQLQAKLLSFRRMLFALRTLSIPLAFYDDFAARNQQMLPIRPISSWLEGETIATADRQLGFEITRLAKMLQNYLGLLSGKALTGRMQALSHAVMVNQDKYLCLIVDSRPTADALYEYLEAQDVDLARITIAASDGYCLNRRSAIDAVLMLDHPSPATMYWLGLHAGTFVIPCLPFERQQTIQDATEWWQRFGMPHESDPQKEAVLRLNFQNTSESALLPQRPLIDVIVQKSLAGAYIRQTKIIPLELKNLADDWLERLQAAQDKMRQIPIHRRSETHVAYAKIWLDGLDEPCLWPENRALIRLLPSDTESVLPSDLKPGDRLVYLPDQPERLATVQSLFDLFAEQTDEGQRILLLSGRWRRDLRAMCSQHHSNGIYRKLATAGLKVKEATVDAWLRTDSVIGPQAPTDILAIGRVKGEGSPENYAAAIQAAVSAVRKRQSSIAHIIEMAIHARAAGFTDIRVGQRRIDPAALDLLFRVLPVIEVMLPAPIQQGASGSGDEDPCRMVERICRDYPDRLLLQSAALRSLRQSPFRNAQKIEDMLRFLAEFVQPHLAGEIAGKNVLDAASGIGVEYSPNTSPVTMGKFADQYQKTYAGKTVSIGAHIGFGTARNPAQTLRMHYHFDPAQKLLVLHHIGKHLDTQQT